MKALPMKLVDGHGYFPCEVDEAAYVRLEMPGPLPYRIIPVILKGARAGTGCWSWNGDTEKPTLKPSILTTSHTMRCHTFVNDGEAQFLSDCTHVLAGKTLPLHDVPIVECNGCKKEFPPECCYDTQGLTVCKDCYIGDQP